MLPTHFEDPQGAFFKLTQTPTICECQTQFQLLSKPNNWFPSNLMKLFHSQLQPHIHQEIQALQPLNLEQAFGLAKIQEEKYFEIRFQKFHSQHPSLSNQHSSSCSTT